MQGPTMNVKDISFAQSRPVKNRKPVKPVTVPLPDDVIT